MKKIFTQIIVVIVFLSFVWKIQAKELNLTVLPSVYEVTTKKNKEITLPYNFVNLGDPDVFNFKIYRLITSNSNDSNALLPYQQSQTSAAFRIDGSSYALDTPFFLKSKQEITIDLIVNIPSEINEKDYYFTFILESADSGQSAGETAVNLQGGVGSNIFITVSEDGFRSVEGKISLFEIPSKYAFSWGGNTYALINGDAPIPMILRVANTGNNLVKASGSITLSSNYSYLKKEKNPSVTISQTFIPTQTETILQSQDDKAGKNSAIFETHPWFGIYTATAAVYLNENSKVLYENAHLIVLPISAIITVVIVLIIFVVFLTLIRRRKKTSDDL